MLIASIFIPCLLCLTTGDPAEPFLNSYDSIEEQYLSEVSKAKGNGKRQYQIGQKRVEALRQLGDEYFPRLDEFHDSKALSCLADCFEKSENWSNAVKSADRAIKIDPTHVPSWTLKLRHATIDTSGESTPIRLLKEALEKTSNNKKLWPYWGIIGMHFAKQNMPSKAITCLDKYFETRFVVARQKPRSLLVFQPLLPTYCEQMRLLGQHDQFLDRVSAYKQDLESARRDITDSNQIIFFEITAIEFDGWSEQPSDLQPLRNCFSNSLKLGRQINETHLQLLANATLASINGNHNWQDIEKIETHLEEIESLVLASALDQPKHVIATLNRLVSSLEIVVKDKQSLIQFPLHETLAEAAQVPIDNPSSRNGCTVTILVGPDFKRFRDVLTQANFLRDADCRIVLITQQDSASRKDLIESLSAVLKRPFSVVPINNLSAKSKFVVGDGATSNWIIESRNGKQVRSVGMAKSAVAQMKFALMEPGFSATKRK